MPTRSPALRLAAAVAALPLLLALGACTSAPSAEVATDTKAVSHSGNDRVPEGAEWTQHYFPSSDGSDVELHADVLRPEGLGEDEKVPVILSVGAYFGHSGETRDENWEHTGPSDRFGDLVEGGDVFDNGYALVMVDLRGFGGSSGCLDFMGAGEQADVQAAIDWAAGQPWSTGAVGMYGKSYDAITGLVGNNLGQDALKAVVAQEPIWDLHQSMRTNGVPRSHISDTSRSYNEAAALPQLPDDDARYLENAEFETTEKGLSCATENSIGYRTADPASEYWTTRDLAARAAGTDTPLFVTQGFLEFVTEPDAMEEFLSNHVGPTRAWLGQWDHVRGNQADDDGTLLMGREGWFAETMSFFDEHLKGVEPTVDYPAYAVQDSSGDWRGQDTWPIADGTADVALAGGTYVDDGAEGDPAAANRFVRQSAPVTRATRVTGTPAFSMNATGHGNVMVQLFDVGPDGTTVMIDEKVSTTASGATSFELKSTDWLLEEGHSLAVGIGTIRSGYLNNWIDTPSGQTIEVADARLELTLDDPVDDIPVPGERAQFLDTYIALSLAELPATAPTFALP